MRRIVPFAKPAYAFAGERTPVRTAVATEITEAARIGTALTTTETIAAAKIVKSRQAGTVSPSGGGANHMTAAMTTMAVRAIARRSGAVGGVIALSQSGEIAL